MRHARSRPRPLFREEIPLYDGVWYIAVPGFVAVTAVWTGRLKTFMNEQRTRHTFRPISSGGALRFAAAAFALLLVSQHLTELFLGQAIYPVGQYGKGGDFRGFYETVRAVWEGHPLTLLGQFYKPPFFALIISPLALLPLDTADIIYRLLTLLSVISVVVLAVRHFKAGFWTQLTLLTAVLLSHPGSFLLDRGNVDGLSQGLSFFSVLMLNCGAFFPAALLFAVACHLKSNALAFLPALLLTRSLKTAFQRALVVAALLLVLAVLTPEWSMQWLEVLARRSFWRRDPWENGSLFRAFLWVQNPEPYAWAVLVGTIAAMGGGLVWRILRGHPPSPVVLFLYLLPYCAAYPKMAYLYTYVFLPLLLLLYCPVVDYCRSRFARCVAAAGIAGVFLSCFPVAFLMNSPLHSMGLAIVPALGLLLCLAANTILAIPLWDIALPEQRPRSEAGRNFVRFSYPIAALVLLSFLVTAVYSVVGYVKGAPTVLWFPESYNSPAGAPHPELPFRIRNPRQGWGRMRINAHLYAGRLRVGGVQYERGISTHAPSDIEILVSGRFSRLSGKYGIDDAQGGRSPQLVFLITDGERVLFRSSPVAPGSPAQPFSVDLSGLDSVHLKVESLGPGFNWGQADWLELKVEE